MIKVSVITPIYNVEKYISRCAKSLFEQTLQDIEYIFVNDCTPDNSMDILNEVILNYPQRKHQITILNHTENKGLAVSRNTGIAAASGEYIIHCDSDDWVEPDMYKEMYLKAIKDNSDIVLCDFWREKLRYSKYEKQYFLEPPHEHIKAILNHQTHIFSCNQLVRKTLFTNHNLKYIEGIDMWEDLLMATKTFFYAKKISCVNKAFYHYDRTNGGSIAICMSTKSLSQMILAVEQIERFYNKQNALEEFLPAINSLKVHIKYRYFKRGDKSVYKKSISLYDELNNSIFSTSTLIRSRKIKLWLAVKCPFLLPVLRSI